MITLTASKLRSFKSCPKKYFFEYIEMLKRIDTPEALSIGSSYHANLEKLHLVIGALWHFRCRKYKLDLGGGMPLRVRECEKKQKETKNEQSVQLSQL